MPCRLRCQGRVRLCEAVARAGGGQLIMSETQRASNSWPPAPVPHTQSHPHVMCLPHTPIPKRAKSWEKLSSHLLSLQSCPALPTENPLSPLSPLLFAYIFLQPNGAFKGLLFHLLINFYLPRQREDNIGDAVCDVCCILTTLQMKFPLE